MTLRFMLLRWRQQWLLSITYVSAYELSSSANRESFDLTSVKPPEMEVKEEDEEVKGSITKCQATVLLGKNGRNPIWWKIHSSARQAVQQYGLILDLSSRTREALCNSSASSPPKSASKQQNFFFAQTSAAADKVRISCRRLNAWCWYLAKTPQRGTDEIIPIHGPSCGLLRASMGRNNVAQWEPSPRQPLVLQASPLPVN